MNSLAPSRKHRKQQNSKRCEVENNKAVWQLIKHQENEWMTTKSLGNRPVNVIDLPKKNGVQVQLCLNMKGCTFLLREMCIPWSVNQSVVLQRSITPPTIHVENGQCIPLFSSCMSFAFLLHNPLRLRVTDIVTLHYTSHPFVLSFWYCCTDLGQYYEMQKKKLDWFLSSISLGCKASLASVYVHNFVKVLNVNKA